MLNIIFFKKNLFVVVGSKATIGQLFCFLKSLSKEKSSDIPNDKSNLVFSIDSLLIRYPPSLSFPNLTRA